MFSCPNCGGNLKFDIPSQQLGCEHCQTLIDPYSMEEKTPATESTNEFEVTVFTCPQCGGEILSTDTSAAEFCSFCGASTILHSRLTKEKRPSYIIPFQKTKEDCKQAYQKMMSRAIFAPKEFKNPKHIDSFRGIYMPYWAFYVEQKGPFSFSGSKSHRKGDYIYTDSYALRGEMDAYYKGLSYDASSSFDDTISEKIAPYDVKGMKAFTPAYLSGFYADTADVDSGLYLNDAETTAFDNSIDQVYHHYPSLEYSGLDFPSDLHTEVKTVDSAMFPVWFLSYRNGNRVAYATVNGQTGKVVSDLPVDIRKYTLGSLLLALPIFVLLNLFFTIIPSNLLAITSFIALFAALIFSLELDSIAEKDAGIHDRGRMFKEKPEMLSFSNKKRKKKAKKKKNSGVTNILPWIIVAFWVFCLGSTFILPILDALSTDLPFVWIIILVIAVFVAVYGFNTRKNLPEKPPIIGFVAALVSIVISAIIGFINPVSDIFYYAGVILSLIAIFITIMDIMKSYNVLATRRLPQFDRTGGDDHA